MKLVGEKEIPHNSPFEHSGIEFKYIDYKNQVYLIRLDDDAEGGNYQTNGVCCSQEIVKGFIHSEFKTGAKWFDPEWWYKKTSWGDAYPEKVYFVDGKDGEDAMNGIQETMDVASKNGRPAENILKSIIKEAISKTGVNIVFDGENTNYGVEWYEAHVPVLFGEKFQHKGILTWMNCD
jgi:hypothetical protein